ncbi:aminoglycoside phosphotransferase family protein [Ktedonospora formicarum]|uniref:Trifolitoxin immunity domain-containing protein n=1 Tax=Ktedonospora formicarum TaxID=2778364 RepID=A0A8J3I386_9CHLR|nr:aminoglycoside phosphotransferase family protein [Ktedonospora formicarum]GHO49322.1 trifolitoxin immunity domain-containing protein [Ktedonospora formicarum]
MSEFEQTYTNEMIENEQEIPLEGGNVTGATRVGQTVRRHPGPWSTTVHTLLNHLEKRGFSGAPRLLGIDAQGREILSFIAGEVGHYPLPDYMWSEEALIAVAHLTRSYHDATIDYVPPTDATWHFVYPDQRQHEVICHGDIAPYNMIYRDHRPHALIDFDTAGPGPRLWDLAYAAYRFAPLYFDKDIQELGLNDPLVQSERLRIFCRAYGLNQPYADILDFVERRLYAMCDWLIEGVVARDPARLRLVNEGHLDHYRREIVVFQHNRPLLQSRLV